MADITLIWAAVLFLASLAFLSISSLFMVNALNRIAKAIKLSPFLIGVLVLSVATTVPELLNVVVSNLKGISELGIGDVVGASIVDLCLILGIVSLIAKSKIGKLENTTFGISLVAIVTFFFLSMDSYLSRFDGAILFALFIFYQLFLYKQGFKTKTRGVQFKKISMAYIMAPLAMFALIVSSFLLVETSSHLGASFGIPVGLIGLIFVSIGTSAPELSSSVVDALKSGEGLGLGTMIGSIVLNFCFATGLGALVLPIAFDATIFQMPLALLFISSAIFITYINIRKETDKYLGVLLLAIYALYIILNI